MGRDGIPLGPASLMLLIYNLAYHVAVFFTALAALLLGGVAVVAARPALKWLMLYGLTVQAALGLAFLAVIFSRRLLPRAVNLVLCLLHKLRLVRDLAGTRAKAERQIAAYREGAAYLKRRPALLARALLLTVVQLLLIYSLPYWIYRALGLSGLSFFHIWALQAALTLAVESVPVPGGVGVTESSFLLLYGGLFGTELVLPALLLCRGCQYYLGVAVGGLLCAVNLRRKAPPPNKCRATALAKSAAGVAKPVGLVCQAGPTAAPQKT